MTVLSADRDVTRKEDLLTQYPVSAGETIYKGALVCVDTDGYLIPASDTVSYKFAGIAYEQADNASGADAAKSCRVYTKGVFRILCQAISPAHVGQLMYVRDDSMVDNTSTNWMCAGRLVKYDAGNYGWVDIGDRVGAADQAIYVPVNTRIYFKGTSNYMYANAAEQLILVAGNTIELQAVTYTNVAGNFQTSGNITLTTSAARIYLRSTTEHIYANAANQLIITATNTINLNATTYVATSGAFNPGGNVTMANNAYLYFRGTTEHIRANAANQLVLTATNTINLIATGYIGAEADIRLSAGKKICYYGTTEHIAGNAANQLVLTATNTINLVATTYVAADIYLKLYNSHDDPPSPTDGMIWYDQVQDKFKGRANGATVAFDVT